MIKKHLDHCDPDYIHCPVSLFSTPYPARIFQTQLRLQPDVNEIVAGIVSSPEQHIHGKLSNFLKQDNFLLKLLQISAKNLRQPNRQTIQLAKVRTDYMIEAATQQPKLVEFNTIASGMGALSVKAR